MCLEDVSGMQCRKGLPEEYSEIQRNMKMNNKMKKFFVLAAAMFTLGLCANAQAASSAAAPGAYDLPLVGEYVNEAGYIVIAPAAKDQNANYDVGIMDKSGKCSIQIVAGTNKVTEQLGVTGPKAHPNTIAAVESDKFPKFALWPEDQTVRLAEDALPFDNIDPACKVFKDHLVFTRK